MTSVPARSSTSARCHGVVRDQVAKAASAADTASRGHVGPRDAGDRDDVGQVRRVDVGALLAASHRLTVDDGLQDARACAHRYAAMPVSASPTTSVCISLVPS